MQVEVTLNLASSDDGGIEHCFLGRNKDDQTSILCPYKWQLNPAINVMKTGLEKTTVIVDDQHISALNINVAKLL